VHSSCLDADEITSFERVRCEFVPSSPFGTPAWYTVTGIDGDTGAVLGRRLTPANMDGTPPELTTAELARLMGGGYRLASVRVDQALKQLMALNDKFQARRRGSRKWSLRKSAPAFVQA
jgi:hypothetical protein